MSLTLQRMEFIRCLFSPDVMFNASEAYRRAYPNCKAGHNKLATRLMANDVIKQAITKKRAEIAKQTGFSIIQAQQEYEEARTLASKTNQPAAMVSATTGKARLYGMDKDAGGGEKTIIIISPKISPELPKPIDSKELENE